jgi:hypothetical protein
MKLLAYGAVFGCAFWAGLLDLSASSSTFFSNHQPNSFLPLQEGAAFGLAPTGGGNVGAAINPTTGQREPITSPETPQAARLVLAQSSIGAAVVATPTGGINSPKEYLRYFKPVLQTGPDQTYWAYPEDPQGDIVAGFLGALKGAASSYLGAPATHFKPISFPGAVNRDNGNTISGDTGRNFFQEEYKRVTEFLRGGVRAFPYENTILRQAQVEALIALMEGYIVAGKNSAYWALRNRYDSASATNTTLPMTQELQRLEQTRQIYAAASDSFLEFLQTHPIDASTIFNGGKPWFPVEEDQTVPALQNKIGEALRLYAFALTREAEIIDARARLLYFNTYGDPNGPDPLSNPVSFDTRIRNNVQAVVAPHIQRLQVALAAASHFTDHPDFIVSGFDAAASVLNNLQNDLATTMPSGRVRFTGRSLLRFNETTGELEESAAELLAKVMADLGMMVTEYSPQYIPFYGVEGENSADALRQKAVEATQTGSIAATAEGATEPGPTGATKALQDLLTDTTSLRDRLESVYSSNYRELIELTGWVLGPDPVNPGQTTRLPDFDRLFLDEPFAGGANQGRTGRIVSQLQAIEVAQRQHSAAVADLIRAQREIDIDVEASQKVFENSAGYANFQTEIGSELSKLDAARGRVQAAAAREKAALQAAEARRRAKRGLFGRVLGAVTSAVSTGIAAFATGGTSLAITMGVSGGFSGISGVISDVKNTMDQAATIEAVGEVDARLATEMAAINSRATELQTMERSRGTMVAAENQLELAYSQIKKQILALERKEMDVLLAEQQVLIQRTELSNLYSRVSYLLGEMNQSIQNQLDRSPLQRAEYWLILDEKIVDAEKTFLMAQEWCYLAAKSLQYYLLPVSGNNAPALAERKIRDVLRARSVKALYFEVSGTSPSSIGGILGTLRGFRSNQTNEFVLRLRSDFFQANRNAFGAIEPTEFSPAIDPRSGDARTGANTSNASLRAWMKFLKDNTTNNVLTIRFSTDLNSWIDAGTGLGVQNPLFNTTETGKVISNKPPGQNEGVYVNVRAPSILTANSQLTVTLMMEGTSKVRLRSYASNPGEPSFRFWKTMPVRSTFGARLNNNTIIGTRTTTDFRELSPANDAWTLIIDGRNPGMAQQLVQFINNYNLNADPPPPGITDIEIGFHTTGRNQ